MKTATFLVWVHGLKGPEPQKWPNMIAGPDGKEKPYLCKHQLKADEIDLPLRVLAKIYPAPPATNET